MMAQKFTLKTSLEIAAPLEKVWAALTEPAQVKVLFWGSDLLTDWQVGHPIVFRGEWEGKVFEDKGTVLRFEPMHVAEYDYWSNFSGTEDAPENYQTITYEFEQSPGGTVLSISQTNILSEEARGHSENNWQQLLQTLKKMVENDD